MPNLEHFLKFLKDNNASHTYFENRPAKGKPCDIYTIARAFDWARTPQGQVYWKTLDRAWTTYCEQHKLKDS